MKTRISMVVLEVVFLALNYSIVYGQGIVGEIHGTVTDPSDALIPGAEVVVRNTATSEERSVTTADAGTYSITSLSPGTYSVQVSKSGFKVATVKDLQVFAKQSREVNVALELGTGMESLTVSAAVVALTTESASQEQVITSSSITALPLDGGNYVALTHLSPGVVPITGQVGAGSSVLAQIGGRTNTSVSIGGNREQDMTYTYDGVESKGYWLGAVGLFPPQDAIAEFKVQQGYLSPEFGPPAVVNVILKSGQNSFHGSVFEFFRNDKLDARNFFDAARPPYKQNQFGITAGHRFPGTEKHHWFGYYQGFRVRKGTTQLGTVPSPQQLQGDFTDLVPFQDGGGCPYDPQNVTGNCLPTTTSEIVDPLTFLGFTTPNVIPAARINSLAKVLIPFFAPPNKPMDAFGNYRISPSRTQNDIQSGIRTDHVLSAKDTVHASFAYSSSDVIAPGLFSVSGGASPLDIRTVGVGWTHIFRPNLVNIFRAGYSDFNQFGIGPVGDADPAALGIKNVTEIPKGCIAYPGISIGQSSGLPTNAGNCFGGHDRDLLLYDDLTWVRGKHTFSFGADIRRASHSVFDQLFLDGYIGFYAGFSGNNTADFVLGAPFFGFFGLGSSAATNNGWWMSYYANDNYRVTPKLTVNLGVRYMNNAPLAPKEHNYGVFDFSTATLLHPPEGGVPPGVAKRANTDFAPRIGLAYQIGEKTVIRSSYGVYFVDDPGDDLSFNALNPPTYGQVFDFGFIPGMLTYTVNEGLPSDILPSASVLATVDPTGTPDGSVSLYTRERNRHSPYMQVWNFSIQRTLPWQMLLDITYGGNKGTHLSKRIDMNTAVPMTGPSCDPTPVPGCDPLTLQERRPYTRWGSIFQSSNRANSNYNALQVKMQKDLSQGLSFLLAYTWSKAISEDDYDALASRNYSWTRLSADRGPATYDRRQRFSSSLTYALPFGRNATGLTRQLAGWNVSLINSFTTGAPFSVTTSSDYAQIGNAVGYPRPDRVCNGNLPKDQRTVERWFDTSCFVAPVSPFPHLGNAGFNFLESDGFVQSDVSVQKEFSFEPLKVEFRGDFFNAFNVVNFGSPGNDIDGADYGVITRALDPRRIQLMLKVTW